MIVRELLTRIGYRVDDKTEKRAEDSFTKLKGAAAKLGIALSAGAVALGIKSFLGAASDVQETLNVVETAFEDQTESVLRWAKESGDAAGRSEFAMRDYASQLGAVVGPTLGSAEATADLSTNMAQLAVDLGSFFNATDEDALNALRAGLIGQAEPLLRFGVAMNVAALDAFALEQGLGKTTKQMSQAEKIQLRYQFILAKTTKAQGDAAKTSDSYANLIKRLEAGIFDLQVAMGEALLPAASEAVKALAEFAKSIKDPLVGFMEALLNTFKLGGALIIGLVEAFKELGAVGKTVIGSLLFLSLAFWAPWLLVPLLAAAAIAGIVIILGDLYKGLTENKGVLAGLADQFSFLEEQSGSTLDAVRLTVQEAVDYWYKYFTGLDNGAWRIGESVRGAFRTMGEGISDAFWAVVDALKSAIGAAWQAWFDFWGFLGDYVGEKVRDIMVFVGEVTGGLNSIGQFLGFGPAEIRTSTRAGAAGTQNVNANQNIEVNVSAPGGNGPEIAAAVAPAVGRAAADGNRRVAQQLLVGGATP